MSTHKMVCCKSLKVSLSTATIVKVWTLRNDFKSIFSVKFKKDPVGHLPSHIRSYLVVGWFPMHTIWMSTFHKILGMYKFIHRSYWVVSDFVILFQWRNCRKLWYRLSRLCCYNFIQLSLWDLNIIGLDQNVY